MSAKTRVTIAGPATNWQTSNGPFNVEYLAASTASGHLVDFYCSSEHDSQSVDVPAKTGVTVAEPATSRQATSLT